MKEQVGYVEFWQTKGMDFIIPPQTEDPEGFDIGEILSRVCASKILEVGCGTGRIARFLDRKKYFGIDISKAAIDKAMADNPDYKFAVYDLEKPLPQSDTVLFYTVCLHIPDDLITAQLKRAAISTKRVVIAEIMNPDYRSNRDPANDYDISNQRSLSQYCDLMRAEGFTLRVAHIRPYKFYEGQDMTFAVFQKEVVPEVDA